MVRADPFAALLIERGAGAYAGIATSRFFERHPQAAQRFGPHAFQAWREQLTRLLSELAASVSDGLPQRFALRVAWTREAFAARSVSPEDLGTSLECLRDVLEEELPRAVAAGVGPYFADALRSVRELSGSTPAPLLPAEETSRALCLAYLAAIGSGDPAAAAGLLVDAVRAGGLSVDRVLAEVLVPAQHELGRLWHLGEISVSEEHLATATTRRVLHQLMTLAPAAKPTGKSVLVAVAAGDLHDLGAALVAAVFELDGWRSLLLGADLPAQDLADAVTRFRVDLVALSATIETQRRKVADAISALREAGIRLPVLVGGAAFLGDDATWRNAGADACALTAWDALAKGRSLVGLSARA